MLRKRRCILPAVIMLASLLWGCGEKSQKGRVGILLPSTETVRWERDGQVLWKHLSAIGYAPVLANAGDNAELQQKQLREMLKDGCRYLIVAAVDGSLLLPDLVMAKADGIRIIAYDRLLTDTDAVDCFVSFDNHRIGCTMGLLIEEKLKLKTAPGPFSLEIFSGDIADSNTALIYQGAMSVLNPYLKQGKLVVRSGATAIEQTATAQWSCTAARTRMDDLLKKFYSSGKPLDAVLAMNDGLAMGVQQALETGYNGRYPVITGQDCALPNVRAILAGKQAMSIFKDTRILAEKTVEVIKRMEAEDHDFFNSLPSVGNRRRNVPACLCPSVPVDAASCRKVLTEAGYYLPAQLQ